LDDFLDMSINVKAVINHQHLLLTKSRWRDFIRLLSTNERRIVTIAYILTGIINLMLLSNVKGSEDPDNNYVPEGTRDSIYGFAVAHVVCSALLVANFLIGTAPIKVEQGWRWKTEVKKKLETAAEKVTFEMAERVLPRSGWALFFLLRDLWFSYYIIFLICSILGLVKNPAFFAFHILDIVGRVRLLGYVMKSVSENIGQVFATLLLGIMLCYIYAVIAYNSWGFGVYEFGDGGGGWTSLYDQFMQHLDYGLRGAPVFTLDDMKFGMYMFDISYNLFIILIMVAMITGIIIDTFADMRQVNNDIEADMKNMCFICSQPRDLFERHGVVFQSHIKQDHNMWAYLYYNMYIDSKPASDRTGIEVQLAKMLQSQSLLWFPTGEALALQSDEEKDEEGLDRLNSQVVELQDQMNDMKQGMDDLRADLGGRLDQLLAALTTPPPSAPAPK